MATYSQAPCEYVYKVSSLEKIVDGDTIDVAIDLGSDVLTKQRVRLLGIDTPESRTRDLDEKSSDFLARKNSKNGALKQSRVRRTI